MPVSALVANLKKVPELSDNIYTDETDNSVFFSHLHVFSFFLSFCVLF